jgi:hypothetical protein
LKIFELMYVSVSSLDDESAKREVAAMVAAAIEKNALLGITGALIFTGVHFVQALEGEEARVRELMRSIEADPRHRSVTVIHQHHSPVRRFVGWSMAYDGRATYVGRPIAHLFDAGAAGSKMRDVSRVYNLMTEFVNSNAVYELRR